MKTSPPIRVIAPNFKRRLSGVTATVVRLVPVQAQDIAIVATGPVIPEHVPQIPLSALLTLPRKPLRVWHARRNVEMIGGLALKYLLGKQLKLIFTSASQRKQSGLTRWLIRRMDAVVATSDKTAAYLEAPSTVIMHGIDVKTFAPADDRMALRAKMGLPTQGQLVGCYGRIRAQKGTDAFVRAMIQIMPQHPDTYAIVMGRAVGDDDAYLTALKEEVAAAGLSERILFKPEVPTEAMADWYAALDLYVAPQRWEGFGLTPLEAMATGCPVIATRVGAFEQLIVEGKTGRLVAPDDIPALAAATDEALAETTKLQYWRDDSRYHVLANFSIEKEAQSLIDLYRRLLGD
ncbi:glycosyltransferase family 4 protein [Sulfitobacter donghicola]|uniref:Glycosyl transferase family 1 n=1 Tax=Sulfitobacter donghicola DSW-25 = KCTC 12864 = JCM 14565 TaxID=1300350 RepID=A0A073IGC6_9RHOB|nr:glycosyltransferase family 4 protein [Sulfitobacter donghicola]KEJ89398.1 glycosyl transferase family 1 [Sulfitobacter donghicola DSW-25 = KCTC 12864 = JCM 14565]KIN69214.1 Lipopolysaccharide core biosynthesis mannosyltransferase LpcC [Sulfitobacter donghicola DSW-25 = KCTC 12864 = JCM 14565]